MYNLERLSSVSFPPGYAWALIAAMSVAVISLTVSFQAGVLSLLFVIVAWWVWQQPVLGFFMLVIISPLLPLLKVTQTISIATLIKDVIIVTLFVHLFLWPLLQKKLTYRRMVLIGPVIGLSLWVSVALLRADSRLLGILRTREILLYILLYFIVLYLPRTKKFYYELLMWLFFSFAITVVASAYQWWFAIDSAVLRFEPAVKLWIPRVSSTFGHPSVFGHYLILIAGICLAAVLVKTSRRVRAGAGFLLLAATLLIYLTYSRAVWLGFASLLITIIGLVATASFKKYSVAAFPWRKLAICCLLLVMVTVAVAQFTRVGVFISSSFDSGYRSNQERLEFLARLLAPLSNHEAIIGRGLGDVLAQNFREVTLTSYDIATGAARNVQLAKNTTLVDNQYLKTLIELGLIGLLLYAWIYWRLLRTGVTTIFLRTGVPRIIALSALGWLISFMLQAIFIDTWDIYPTNALFWIMAGLVSATSGNNKVAA